MPSATGTCSKEQNVRLKFHMRRLPGIRTGQNRHTCPKSDIRLPALPQCRP
jgi:hypothetical protein